MVPRVIEIIKVGPWWYIKTKDEAKYILKKMKVMAPAVAHALNESGEVLTKQRKRESKTINVETCLENA